MVTTLAARQEACNRAVDFRAISTLTQSVQALSTHSRNTMTLKSFVLQ